MLMKSEKTSGYSSAAAVSVIMHMNSCHCPAAQLLLQLCNFIQQVTAAPVLN